MSRTQRATDSRATDSRATDSRATDSASPTRGRAGILRAVAVLMATGAITLTAPSAMACACGGMVGPDEADMRIGRETAVLHWDGQQETIHLQLNTESSETEAGLLLPTPAPAQVALGDEEMFGDLEQISRPRVEERRHLFGPPTLFGSGGDTAGSAPGEGGVNVLSVEDLGPLEATVLTADDPAALQAWLDEHGYLMSEEFAAVVTPYTQEGWAFVAVQLTAEGQRLNGDLPPLEVSFDAEELIYPMRMSQAAQDQQATRTYVLSDHKVERTDATAGQGSRAEVIFAGAIDQDEDVNSPALATLVATAPFLTTIDQDFPAPEVISSDFTFAQAGDDEPFQRVDYYDTYLIPVDVAVILGLLGVGVIGAVVAVVVRARRARRA